MPKFPSTYGGGDDRPHKLTEIETMAHEAREAGRVDEAQFYATLHQAEVLRDIQGQISILWSMASRAIKVVADNRTAGCV
ncbi:hypothetical protein [Actinopolymorpha pittospori]